MEDLSMCENRHEHHRVVFWQKEDHHKAVPEDLCVRRGDFIRFIAVGADFIISDFDDIFTIPVTGELTIHQDSHVDLVIKDDAAYDVYHYSYGEAPPPPPPVGVGGPGAHQAKKARYDPTIIIHGDEN